MTGLSVNQGFPADINVPTTGTILAGNTCAAVRIVIFSDNTLEATENIPVTLTATNGAVVNNQQGVFTLIINGKQKKNRLFFFFKTFPDV